jgi:hypothetical protein
MTIFLKMDKVKKLRKFYLSSRTNKSILNFRESSGSKNSQYATAFPFLSPLFRYFFVIR